MTVPAGTDPREAFVAVRDKDGKRVTDKDGYDLRVNIVAPNYGDATAVKPGEKGTSKDPATPGHRAHAPAAATRDTSGAYLGGAAQFSLDNLTKKGTPKP